MRTAARAASPSGHSAPGQLSLPGFDVAPSPVQNLFFAILPDRIAAGRATRLAWSLRDEHGSPRTPLAPACLHISLIGFGVDARPRPELVARVSDAAAAIALRPFEVELDRVMTFRGEPRRLPVVLLGDSTVSALSLLRSTLGAQITSLAFEHWARSRFTPHLTLFYGERPVEQRTVPAISWPVREFVLICGRRSPHRHIVFGRWPLRG